MVETDWEREVKRVNRFRFKEMDKFYQKYLYENTVNGATDSTKFALE